MGKCTWPCQQVLLLAAIVIFVVDRVVCAGIGAFTVVVVVVIVAVHSVTTSNTIIIGTSRPLLIPLSLPTRTPHQYPSHCLLLNNIERLCRRRLSSLLSAAAASTSTLALSLLLLLLAFLFRTLSLATLLVHLSRAPAFFVVFLVSISVRDLLGHPVSQARIAPHPLCQSLM